MSSGRLSLRDAVDRELFSTVSEQVAPPVFGARTPAHHCRQKKTRNRPILKVPARAKDSMRAVTARVVARVTDSRNLPISSLPRTS